MWFSIFLDKIWIEQNCKSGESDGRGETTAALVAAFVTPAAGLDPSPAICDAESESELPSQSNKH